MLADLDRHRANADPNVAVRIGMKLEQVTSEPKWTDRQVDARLVAVQDALDAGGSGWGTGCQRSCRNGGCSCPYDDPGTARLTTVARAHRRNTRPRGRRRKLAPTLTTATEVSGEAPRRAGSLGSGVARAAGATPGAAVARGRASGTEDPAASPDMAGLVGETAVGRRCAGISQSSAAPALVADPRAA